MFGKPEWFREKRNGWGYAAGWTGVIGFPFALLVERHQGVEALIWLATSMLLLLWDAREIVTAKHRGAATDAATDVLYIGDDESEIEQQAATRRFRFRWWK